MGSLIIIFIGPKGFLSDVPRLQIDVSDAQRTPPDRWGSRAYY